MDKGPWILFLDDGRVAGVASQDFRHDVALFVSGDFADDNERREYCEWLCRALNGEGE